jgi:hypothetical protein
MRGRSGLLGRGADLSPMWVVEWTFERSPGVLGTPSPDRIGGDHAVSRRSFVPELEGRLWQWVQAVMKYCEVNSS